MALPTNLDVLFANLEVNLKLSQVVIGLLLSALLSYILGKLYVAYGTSLSNRKRFASNFVLLTTSTALIIMIVKSSLALSLGLVGALSIVRFRAAIKEPEELVFLFINIAIGLGVGANQWIVTTVAFIVLCGLIALRHFTHKKEEGHNLYLSVGGKVGGDLTLKNITEVMKKHCKAVQLKRFDEVDGALEASMLVDFDSYENLEEIKKDLNKLSKSVRITYLDKT